MRPFTVITVLPVLAVVLPVLSTSYPEGSTCVTRAQEHGVQPQAAPALDTSAAQNLLNKITSPFVPNLGQWEHQGRFVHRSGPMTLFLTDRGWVVDLVERPVAPETRSRAWGSGMQEDRSVEQKTRGVALRMNFEGDAYVPEIVGEKRLNGHHNYFLGNDESRWRTHVPLYASVRYQELYPGIDVRLRQANGVPEYDLLLQPGANLSLVRVHVEGGQGLSIAKDGSLVIQTELGPLTQPRPKTWTVDAHGRKHEVACHFTLLGNDRFGFEAPGWDGDTSLNIDPPLIWSTFLGGSANDSPFAMDVDASGVVRVAGTTKSSGTGGFPTTIGAYNRTYNNGANDAFLTCLDPSKTGAAQLIYSTYLGGNGDDRITGVSVDANGVVTVAGGGNSSNFPTTKGAYDATWNGGRDGFVCRLDPNKTGAARLVYSTYLGGSTLDHCQDLHVDASGVATVAGMTMSQNFPTTTGAFSTTYNGGTNMGGDAFVSRLDPSKATTAQLVYSTYLGGASYDHANQLAVDTSGVVTVGGFTFSKKYPCTKGAYNTIYNTSGLGDAIISQLDPSKTGTAQLVYSTFLGGSQEDDILGLTVDAKGNVIVTGWTTSSNFPTTKNAYDATYNGGTTTPGGDIFVSRLIPLPLGQAGLSYSTFLGGSGDEVGATVAVDANGVMTLAGATSSSNFPMTGGAYDTTYNGVGTPPPLDVIVSRLDPSMPVASQQLVYSTYLGGSASDWAAALWVDPSGVATVAGGTASGGFPTTGGAYSRTYNTSATNIGDVFVSRLDMGVPLYGDVHEISLRTGGTQTLTVNAGKAHAGRSYWVFGSVTGTTPGVTLGSAIGPVHIPLNPDVWTGFTIVNANVGLLGNTKGTLDGSGTAKATFSIPTLNLPNAIGLVFHHAYLVYDQKNNFYLASNAVPLKLVK